MILKLAKNTLVVFDLDDTLYPEADFVSSAFAEIAEKLDSKNADELHSMMMEIFNKKEDVFEYILNRYHGSRYKKIDLVDSYRNHYPVLNANAGAKTILDDLLLHAVPMALITDGRSITQRNKIKALGVEKYFAHILISEETGYEKASGESFKLLEELYTDYSKFNFGDNVNKDFAWPQQLGWTTIGLADKGRNIHKQDLKEESCAPMFYINSFTELTLHYE